MFDTYKMQEVFCKELEKKAETGLRNTADLDTVWKLIDAYKNLLKIDKDILNLFHLKIFSKDMLHLII